MTSPSSSTRWVGSWCGSAACSPNATIDSNDSPSAPARRSACSSSSATWRSVIPTASVSRISSNAASVHACASSSSAISSASFTHRRRSTASPISTNSTSGTLSAQLRGARSPSSRAVRTPAGRCRARARVRERPLEPVQVRHPLQVGHLVAGLLGVPAVGEEQRRPTASRSSGVRAGEARQVPNVRQPRHEHGVDRLLLDARGSVRRASLGDPRHRLQSQMIATGPEADDGRAADRRRRPTCRRNSSRAWMFVMCTSMTGIPQRLDRVSERVRVVRQRPRVHDDRRRSRRPRAPRNHPIELALVVGLAPRDVVLRSRARVPSPRP